MKNIDAIRQMTTEELAKFIGKNKVCDHCETERCNEVMCIDWLKKWLDQEISL